LIYIHKIYNTDVYVYKKYIFAKINKMKRISLFLREDQIKSLNELADFKKVSYSELVREAVDYKMLTEFGKQSVQDIIEDTRGILKDRFNENVKSEEIIDNLRDEWEKRIERNKK
jgi:predicted oxidoreductase